MIRDADHGSLGFGGLLRRFRMAAGLTQEELADAAKVSTRSVSDLEREVSRTARPQTARLLAAALGLAGPDRARFLITARGEVSRETRPPMTGEALASAEAATRALPRDITGFTGRASELGWLMARLAGAAGRGSRAVGICAVGGMAGVGKTTLAVHAAHRLAAGYPDGQFFLPLHGHTPGHRPADPADALASLLLAAGVPARQIPPGLEPRAARWRDFLAGKKVLLVLDDAAGHEQVEPLLPGTPGSIVLVTSRRRLAALGDAAVVTLDVLTPDEAAGMLVRLAGRPGLQPADPQVGELARLCGYLPLAIGMLASRLRHHPAWTPADLAAGLAAERDRLGLMHAEDLSVGAAFSLSYRDLTAGQRRLFRRLGLHPGPDTDAHAAAAVGGLALATARRYLEAIYDQHLIAEPSRGRYRMHDLVREHARALAADDDATVRDAAVGRLMDYYLQTVLEASRLIGTRILNYMDALPTGVPPACAPRLSTAGEATRWMQAEDANLRAAAELAAAAGRVKPATLIPGAMAQFLYLQGRWQDGVALHQSAVTAARDAGDAASQLSALYPLIHMQMMTGDYGNVQASLSQSLALSRQLGDRAKEAESRSLLGLMHANMCDFRAGMASLLEALAICRDIGGDRQAAAALHGIGGVHFATGNYRAAAASHRQALDLYRSLGETVGEAEALLSLSQAEIMTGDYAGAKAALDKAGPIAVDLGDRHLQGWALTLTGVAQRLTGNLEAAAASQQAALERFDALNLATEQAGALNELGLTLQLTGDLAAAGAAHQRALVICSDTRDRLGEAEVLNSLGELSLRHAAPGDARSYHGQALALAREIGVPREEARALDGIGRSHLHDGHIADGTPLLREALAIYRLIGAAAARGVEETLATVLP